jgi:hypothetical protein
VVGLLTSQIEGWTQEPEYLTSLSPTASPPSAKSRLRKLGHISESPKGVL